jgi:hypothetical protein
LELKHEFYKKYNWPPPVPFPQLPSYERASSCKNIYTTTTTTTTVSNIIIIITTTDHFRHIIDNPLAPW